MSKKDNPFARALGYIEKNITDSEGRPLNRPQIMYILDCSHSYFYRCMKEGQSGIGIALKIENLTDGEVRWQELCPKLNAKVASVRDRVATAFTAA